MHETSIPPPPPVRIMRIEIVCQIVNILPPLLPPSSPPSRFWLRDTLTADMRCLTSVDIQTHAVVAVILSTLTIWTGCDSTFSTAASVSFFGVDTLVMMSNGRRQARLGQVVDSSGCVFFGVRFGFRFGYFFGLES